MPSSRLREFWLQSATVTPVSVVVPSTHQHVHHEVVPSLGHVVKDLFELAEPHECLLTSLGVRCQKVTTQLLDHLGILSLTTISEIVEEILRIVWRRISFIYQNYRIWFGMCKVSTPFLIILNILNPTKLILLFHSFSLSRLHLLKTCKSYPNPILPYPTI